MAEWSQNNSGRVDQVWKNLADSFGPRFLRDYGNSAPDIWRNAIVSLKDHEIAKGFRRLSMHGSGSCPTLPQFVKACKAVGGDEGQLHQRRTYPQITHQEDLRDNWDRFADHLFLNYLMRKEGCAFRSLKDLLEVKRNVTAAYRSIGAEEHVEPEEMRDELIKQLDKLWIEPPPEDCKGIIPRELLTRTA